MTTFEPPIIPRDAGTRSAAPLRALDAVADRFDAATMRLANAVADRAWVVLHVMGAHRWREGYETDLERGWRQYRGSRCTICEAPWEGW